MFSLFLYKYYLKNKMNFKNNKHQEEKKKSEPIKLKYPIYSKKKTTLLQQDKSKIPPLQDADDEIRKKVLKINPEFKWDELLKTFQIHIIL